jgi:hypothetical protein
MLGGFADLVVLLLNLGLRHLRKLEPVLCQESIAEAKWKRGAGQVDIHERAGRRDVIPLPEPDQTHAGRIQIELLHLARALAGAWCCALAPVDRGRRDGDHIGDLRYRRFPRD